MGMIWNDLDDGVVVVWVSGVLPYPARLSAPVTLTLALSRRAGEGICVIASRVFAVPFLFRSFACRRVFMATFGVAPPPAPFQGRRVVFALTLTLSRRAGEGMNGLD